MSLKALSHRKAFDQIFFETKGSINKGDYNITLNYPEGQKVPLPSVSGNKKTGLKETRLIISNYILNNMNGSKDTIFNQYCISPDRDPKDNKWDQWKVSQFI
ncbi:hypothetical protein ACPOM7_15100 [Peribacillus castrilensis]|uniref:hypothetical protein n=1 Tax=Bacillaceae TaxID=186817 RepID=UPI0006629C5E|nr:hypothetical protein [Bacillus sp. 445_BSPC]